MYLHNKAVFISHNSNSFEKGMYPTVLHSTKNKYLGKPGFLALLQEKIQEKENYEF